MKLIHSNGKKLTVHEVGDEALMTFTATVVPLRHNGYHMVSDDRAREIIRDILRSGLYNKE